MILLMGESKDGSGPGTGPEMSNKSLVPELEIKYLVEPVQLTAKPTINPDRDNEKKVRVLRIENHYCGTPL